MENFAHTEQKSRLGQILVSKKLISNEQLSQAMTRQANTGERLGDILTQWNVVTQRHIESALKTQRRLRLVASLVTATMTPMITACGGGGGGGDEPVQATTQISAAERAAAAAQSTAAAAAAAAAATGQSTTTSDIAPAVNTAETGPASAPSSSVWSFIQDYVCCSTSTGATSQPSVVAATTTVTPIVVPPSTAKPVAVAPISSPAVSTTATISATPPAARATATTQITSNLGVSTGTATPPSTIQPSIGTTVIDTVASAIGAVTDAIGITTSTVAPPTTPAVSATVSASPTPPAAPTTTTAQTGSNPGGSTSAATPPSTTQPSVPTTVIETVASAIGAVTDAIGITTPTVAAPTTTPAVSATVSASPTPPAAPATTTAQTGSNPGGSTSAATVPSTTQPSIATTVVETVASAITAVTDAIGITTPTVAAPTTPAVSTTATISATPPAAPATTTAQTGSNPGNSTSSATPPSTTSTEQTEVAPSKTTATQTASASDTTSTVTTQPNTPAPVVVAPSLPTNLGATAPSGTHIKLTWSDNSAGTAKYRIYRDGDSTPLAEVSGTSYTDSTVNANTAYSYQIRAVATANNSNTSGLSTFPSITTPTAQSTLVFSSDFENGMLTGWSKELAAVPHAAQVVSAPSPVRAGAKALRIELHNDDPDVANGRRAELALAGATQNGEYWYAFSVYLPADYAADLSQESLAQWHNVPDFDLGETWMGPPISLRTSNGHWTFNRLWDDAPVSTTASVVAKGNYRVHDLGVNDGDKGRWTDWVLHVKWGWQASQDPKLELYKNGVLVLDQNGMPNTLNNAAAPYFKMGVYKWDWKEAPKRSALTTRVVYYDRVMIGNSNSTLRDMQ